MPETATPKLSISAFVVSRNEGNLLRQCLDSIAFCDDIVLIDLESTDNTETFAQKSSIQYIRIKPIPILEMIHERYMHLAKNDWIILIDPDEVLTESLQLDIMDWFKNLSASNKYAIYTAPIIYFFKRKPLTYTSWGGVKTKRLLINRKHIAFKSNVHRGAQLHEGYLDYHAPHTGNNHIIHYWMQDYTQLISKHVRYLKHEGKSRYESGKRTSLKRVLFTFVNEFYKNYLKAKGYKGLLRGLFLSLFRAWYFGMAELKLYTYQQAETRSLRS